MSPRDELQQYLAADSVEPAVIPCDRIACPRFDEHHSDECDQPAAGPDVRGVGAREAVPAVDAVAAVLRGDVFPRDGRHYERNAATVLAFIRDAIHRDGDDADAIREALGLRVEQYGLPRLDGRTLIESRTVALEWRERYLP